MITSTKPFKLAVFLSRIHAGWRVRRISALREIDLASNGIRVQRLEHNVYKNGEPVNLTAGSIMCCACLWKNPNQVLTPEQILSKLWDCDENYVDANTLTVYIRRLRAKIEDDPSNPKKIVTRRAG